MQHRRPPRNPEGLVAGAASIRQIVSYVVMCNVHYLFRSLQDSELSRVVVKN